MPTELQEESRRSYHDGRLKTADHNHLRLKAFAAYYLALVSKIREKGRRGKIQDECAKTFNVPKNTIKMWLAHPVVAAEEKALLEKSAKKAGVKGQFVLDELLTICTSDIKDYFDDKDGYIALKSLKEMGRRSKAVESIENNQTVTEVTVDGVTTRTIKNNYKIKLWSKPAALRLQAEIDKLVNGVAPGGVVLCPQIVYSMPDNGMRLPKETSFIEVRPGESSKNGK